MTCHGKPSPPSLSPEWQPVGPNEIRGYVTPSKVTDDQRQMISSTSCIIIICTSSQLHFPFCEEVQSVSRNPAVFEHPKGPIGLFGGNRYFFTNKEAYWATSIGLNGRFDSNFSWNPEKSTKTKTKSGEKQLGLICHSPLINLDFFGSPNPGVERVSSRRCELSYQSIPLKNLDNNPCPGPGLRRSAQAFLALPVCENLGSRGPVRRVGLRT